MLLCSFQGHAPANQPSVAAVQKYICGAGLVSYINFHSYSQLWMTPWGWTSAHPKDYDALMKA